MIIVRGSRKYLFLKYGRKIRAEFLEMLKAAILMASSSDIFRSMLFCSAIRYIASKKQPVGSTLEVLAESLGTALDEAYFIVNLHSFL